MLNVFKEIFDWYHVSKMKNSGRKGYVAYDLVKRHVHLCSLSNSPKVKAIATLCSRSIDSLLVRSAVKIEDLHCILDNIIVEDLADVYGYSYTGASTSRSTLSSNVIDSQNKSVYYDVLFGSLVYYSSIRNNISKTDIKGVLGVDSLFLATVWADIENNQRGDVKYNVHNAHTSSYLSLVSHMLAAENPVESGMITFSSLNFDNQIGIIRVAIMCLKS